MLQSGSTQLPPTGTNCPVSTFARMRSHRSGLRSLIQAYCCACEQAKRYSGYSSMYRVWLPNVRTVLRYVSASGQSHAVSMCACPIAADLVRARAVVVLVERREDRRIALVAEAVQLSTQMAGPARLERVGRLERAQQLEVVVEPPRILVEQRELADDELGLSFLRAEEAVARQLERELDLLAAARVGEHGRVRALRVLDPVQPLHGAAVDPERRLRRRRPEQVDAPARATPPARSPRSRYQYVAQSGPRRSRSCAGR